MGKPLSILLDTLLPNRAWIERMRAAGPENRILYWALRIGLTVLLVVVVLLLNIQQHFAVR